MKITDSNYTITTVYFDGQLWCALIEKNINGENFKGKYIFGEEPSNPRLLNWMLCEFSEIPLFKTDSEKKIRFSKLVKKHNNTQGKNIPKSLTAFSKAQKEYAEGKKAQNKKQKKLEAKEKYLLKQKKKKERK